MNRTPLQKPLDSPLGGGSYIIPLRGRPAFQPQSIRRVKSINILKPFDFSLAEIREILEEFEVETDMLDSLRRKLEDIRSKIRRYHEVSPGRSNGSFKRKGKQP